MCTTCVGYIFCTHNDSAYSKENAFCCKCIDILSNGIIGFFFVLSPTIFTHCSILFEENTRRKEEKETKHNRYYGINIYVVNWINLTMNSLKVTKVYRDRASWAQKNSPLITISDTKCASDDTRINEWERALKMTVKWESSHENYEQMILWWYELNEPLRSLSLSLIGEYTLSHYIWQNKFSHIACNRNVNG